MKTPCMLFTIILIFTSCTNSPSNSGQEEAKDNPAISLQTFTEIPDAIDGCACLFAEDHQAFKNQEYIYADNMQDAGFVKIDHNIVQITLDESDHNSDDEILSLGRNEDMEVKLDIRRSSQLDEQGSYFGTLEVKTKDGRKYKKNVFGECGC